MDKAEEKPSFRNIIILGIGFMLLMAAWITIAGIEQTILQSVQTEDPSFTGDGYISLSLINGVFSLANFIAPVIVSFVGVRTMLIIGTSFYAVFIAGFYYPNEWILYSTSASLGFMAACIWIANGVYFTRCSTKETIGKNMGIYWVILAMGQLFGNAFVYWKFKGKSLIDKDTRFFVISVLTIISVMSTITFFFLGPPRPNGKKDCESGKKEEKSPPKSFLKTLLEPFTLLGNKHMLLLIPPSIYNGLEIAFFMGIFPTAVGFSEAFGSDARKLVGVVGIVTGVGTVLAGLIFGVFGHIVVKSKRYIIFIVACVGHTTCFALIYINLHNDSPLGPTPGVSWINPPSIPLALVCAFLLGVGDSCITPQMGAAIGVIWPDDPSAAFAMYRFFQAAMAAVGFYISTLTGLYNQLVIFLVVALAGTASFCYNEFLIEKMDKKALNTFKPTISVSVIDK